VRDIHIVGVGQVPVVKQYEGSVRALAGAAVKAALDDAGPVRPDALYVGSMLSGLLSNQSQLAAGVASEVGLRGIEALTLEAACGSGGAAARTGAMAIASGSCEAVVVAGVEKMSAGPRDEVTKALATASDWTTEGAAGQTFVTLNAQLMRLYMQANRVGPEVFAPFAVNAHANAARNPNARFHKPIDVATYLGSKVIHDPVRLFDASPICDGAAAVVLASADIARELGGPSVVVRASTVGTDALGIADRPDPLALSGARASAARAYSRAGMSPSDVDIFELHDAYTIISVLSLEAAGFAPRGKGWTFGTEGAITLTGSLPITTMGGLKARGHPVGASGVYQLVEAFLQLTGRAGPNQVDGPTVAMTQSVGGTGATVATHLLERVN